MTQLLHSCELPATSGKPSRAALFLLHGYGANELDLLSVGQSMGPRLHVVSLRAPLPVGPNAYMWWQLFVDPMGALAGKTDFEGAKRARASVLEQLERYKAAHPGIPVYLLGFSQGTALAVIVGLTCPGVVEGVIGFSGGFPPEFLPDLQGAVGPRREHFWIAHGSEDQIVPIAVARSMKALLQRLQVDHRYREFPAGHHLTPEMIADARRWLWQQLEPETVQPSAGEGVGRNG